MAFPIGYTKYQEITIDNTKVTADQTDFVIYVNLANLSKAGADIFDTCRSDGGDIRVTKSDGTTELAREVVDIDTTAKTGELHIKFSGTLSSSSDTTIRIYYNGTDTEPATTDTYGRNAVWSNYKYVLHLNEAVNTTADGYKDSTGNGYDAVGVSMAITETEGRLAGGNAQNFDGSADYILLDTGAITSSGTHTAQVWYKGTDTGGMLMSGYKAASPFNGWVMGIGIITSGKVSLYTNSAGWLTGATSVNDDAWRKVDIKRDGANWHVFVDGASDVTPVAGTYSDSGQNGAIGARQDPSNFLSGAVDEARFSLQDLSSTWLATEYNNQNSPSTFYATGDEVSSGAITINPVAQSATFSIPTATVKLGVTQSPTAQVATFSIPTYTVAGAAVINPAAQSAVFSIPAYTIDAGGNVTVPASVITASFSIPAYAVEHNARISPNAQVATFSTQTPTLSLGTGVQITPASQVATLSIPTPTVTAQRSIIVSVATQVLTFAIPTLAKVGGVWTKVARQTDATWNRRSVNDD